MNLDTILKDAKRTAKERLKSQGNPLTDDALEVTFSRVTKGVRLVTQGPLTLCNWWTAFRPDDRIDVGDKEKSPRVLIYDRIGLRPLPMSPIMAKMYGFKQIQPGNIFERDALNAFWNAVLTELRSRHPSSNPRPKAA